MSKTSDLRIELTPDTKEVLENYAEQAGMTQTAVASRLVEWFALQPELVQSAVLRQFPTAIQCDVAALVLKQMVSRGEGSQIKEAPGRPVPSSL